MWDVSIQKLMCRVQELLSRENTVFPDCEGGKRSPRKKKECPFPRPTVDDRTPKSDQITRNKFIIKNLGRNPDVIGSENRVFKKLSCKNPNTTEAPRTSTGSLKNLGRIPRRRRDSEEEKQLTTTKNPNVLSRNLPESPIVPDHRPTVGDGRLPGSEIKGNKFVIKNIGRNPFVVCSRDTVFENRNTSEIPASTRSSKFSFCRNLKRRRVVEEEEQSKTRKNLNLSRNLPQSPPPTQDLPQAFKNRILEIGGCLENVVLVIQKELFESDLNRTQGRLSIPHRKVNAQFLNSNEVDYLETPKARIEARLIQPCLQECGISLRNWKTNKMYALASTWNEVCKRNQLRQGNTIQLWSFRRNSELCFGIVLIK